MSLAGKFLAFDAAGDPIGSAGTGADLGLREDLAGPAGGSLVANQLPEGADLRAQTLSEYIEGGPLQPSQFSGNAGERFERAIVEAGTSRNDGTGQTVALPRGELRINKPFNCADRVSIIGVNKRGSIIMPAAGFVGAHMATAINGGESMFDNALERLTLNCNHMPGLGGIVADAWQEGGGLQKVLIWRFTTEGVRIRCGDGGAAHCQMVDVEIMGSNQIRATTGIYFEKVSSVGAFILTVTNATITGSPNRTVGGDPAAFRLTNGIHVEKDSLICNAVHFEETKTGIYLDGDGHHILNGVTGAESVTNVVEIAKTFIGTVEMRGCRRWGATNLLKDCRPGGLGEIAHDTDIIISPPLLGIGANAAGGNFDGTLAPPNINKSFGVSGIVRNAPGVYQISLNQPGSDANSFTAYGSSNTPGGLVNVDLASGSSLILTHRVLIYDELTDTMTWTPTDANEIKFTVVRCA